MNTLAFAQVVQQSGCSRRRFIGGALSAAVAGPLLGTAGGLAAENQAPQAELAPPRRKIKLGWVGCGGRGSWIASLFKQHGGYEFHAVADYFQPSADGWSDAMGTDKSRRFSGLSGYKKVLETGVEAIVLETPPGFFPEHAAAAADAGVHVYVAKPVAVDVPGCLAIEAAARRATQHQRVFFVDYQMPTDPSNTQVVERLQKEERDKIVKIVTTGICGGHDDPPKTATLESRLAGQVWDSDICLSGSYIATYDIHAIDAALWVLGQRPVAAVGSSRICRPNAHGDSQDVCSVLFEYADGVIHEHSGMAIPNATPLELTCNIYSPTVNARVAYDGQVHFHRRGQRRFQAVATDLYGGGAARNIATFYQNVITGRHDNPTVRRAVDGCLTCILGREAGLRRRRVTMQELVKENKRLELDLRGLKT